MNIFSEVFYDFLLVFVLGYAAGVISTWILADACTYYRSKRHQDDDGRPLEPVDPKVAALAAAARWVLDDMGDAGQVRNEDTGDEYDSCTALRVALERAGR